MRKFPYQVSHLAPADKKKGNKAKQNTKLTDPN